MNTWVFQVTPKFYLVDEALKALSEHTWLTTRHVKHIKVGDEVLIWRCGKGAALVGFGTVLTDPASIEVPAEEKKFEAQPLKFDGKRMRVKIRLKKLNPPVSKETILKQRELSSIPVFKGCTGTNFTIPSEAAAAIQRLIQGTF